MQELLTALELAKALKVSQASVRGWTRQGIPQRRLAGRLVRFELEKALKWLEERTNEDEEAGGGGAENGHAHKQ